MLIMNIMMSVIVLLPILVLFETRVNAILKVSIQIEKQKHKLTCLCCSTVSLATSFTYTVIHLYLQDGHCVQTTLALDRHSTPLPPMDTITQSKIALTPAE